MRVLANPAQRSVPTPEYVAVVHGNSPYISVYPWRTSTNGFGTKYADIPSGGPNNTVADVVWKSQNTDIMFVKGGSVGTPYMYAYPWTFYGFGTKYSDAASQPDDGMSSIALNGNDRDVAVTWGVFWSGNSTQGLSSFPFTSGTGWGTKYSAAPSRPSSSINIAYGAAFRPQRNAVSVGMSTDPFLYVCGYNSGAGGFTTKFADPGLAIRPSATVLQSSWGPLRGIDVAFGSSASPYAIIYQWNATTGFVAKWVDPSPGFSNRVDDIEWNPTETVVAVAQITTSPYVLAYEWSTSTGWGTKFANPATLPTGSARSISWESDGSNIIVGHNTSPYITAYSWSNGFGTKYSDPSTLPTGNTNRAKFSN